MWSVVKMVPQTSVAYVSYTKYGQPPWCVLDRDLKLCDKIRMIIFILLLL